jgi:hypothetical protein
MKEKKLRKDNDETRDRRIRMQEEFRKAARVKSKLRQIQSIEQVEEDEDYD